MMMGMRKGGSGGNNEGVVGKMSGVAGQGVGHGVFAIGLVGNYVVKANEFGKVELLLRVSHGLAKEVIRALLVSANSEMFSQLVVSLTFESSGDSV